eukprot:snap_masked-scaffold_7-processed-gene-1.41-mRNA-1 protein AED:1.00 eAED:1.00 QI:0/0/0/0/1/1/2/0/73
MTALAYSPGRNYEERKSILNKSMVNVEYIFNLEEQSSNKLSMLNPMSLLANLKPQHMSLVLANIESRRICFKI